VRPSLVTALTLVLLWALVAQANHALAEVRVYLFLGALFVAFSALRLPLRGGIITSLIGGMICDANAPVVFGTHALLFAVAHAVIFHLRDRIPRDDTIARILVVLLTNLGLFLVFSFIQIARSPAPAAVWPRLIADLLCSQVVITVITPWFLALQQQALVVTGATRDLPS
jgi:rod shape-determining protein MreD